MREIGVPAAGWPLRPQARTECRNYQKTSRRCGMMADREIGVPGAGWPLRAQARTDCRCYQKASRRCGMMADREIGVPGVGWPLRAQARTSACATKGQQISPIEKCSEAG